MLKPFELIMTIGRRLLKARTSVSNLIYVLLVIGLGSKPLSYARALTQSVPVILIGLE